MNNGRSLARTGDCPSLRDLEFHILLSYFLFPLPRSFRHVPLILIIFLFYQIFGLISFIWLVAQIAIGAGSVWFGGALFGGGEKAKRIYKYHRYGTLLSICLIYQKNTKSDPLLFVLFVLFLIGKGCQDTSFCFSSGSLPI